MARWRAAIMILAFLVGCGGGLPAPIAGPTWHATNIGGHPVLTGTMVTAVFSTENRVSGKAGCNNYFGSAKPESGSISVGPLASTRKGCAVNVMVQEYQYLATLEAADSYQIRGDVLQVESSGAPTIIFRAR